MIIHFVYVAPLNTEFTKCFDNKAKVGNSGRKYNRTDTQQSAEQQM